MGVSSDAIIVYGVPLNEDYDEIYNRIHACYDQMNPNKVDAYDWAKEEEFMTHFGVELVHHCSDSYTMHILGVEKMRAWRGDTRLIDTSMFQHDLNIHKMQDKIMNAIAELKLPSDAYDQMGWYLVSWMG